jgi:hypothetical protein
MALSSLKKARVSRANACATFSGISRDLVGMGCSFRLMNTLFNY